MIGSLIRQRATVTASLCCACRFLLIVSSADAPFGIHFDGPINDETKKAIKSLKSPADGWTYILNWHDKALLWAHMKPVDHPGFCTLQEMINTPEFIELWNNPRLVESVRYVKDRYDGPEIEEATALELNARFKPELSSTPSTPASSTAQRRKFN